MFEEPNTIPTEDDMNAMYKEEPYPGYGDDEMNARYEEYEMRVFQVQCVYCLTRSEGTQKELDRRGWYLGMRQYPGGPVHEVCQFCIDHDCGIAIGRFQKAMENYDEAVERLAA